MVNRITRFGFVNAYLVDEGDGLTLIDTTLSGGHKPILAAAARLGKPITTIALTHGHMDHVGALDALHEALPGAAVVITARDERLLSKDTSLDPGEPGKKVTGSVTNCKTRPTRTIAEGDSVGSLQVIATPGHTPGHVSFLDPRDGTLYTGDAYTTFAGVATAAKGPAFFPLAAMATWNKPVALESARKLRALNPARLAAGHGKVVENPAAAMDAAIGRGA